MSDPAPVGQTGPVGSVEVGARRAAPAPRGRRRDYPGWRMVWALAGTEIVSYGVLYYAFAVFLVPMREDLGASTPGVAAALSIGLAVSAAAAPAAGRWLDAHGARALMTTGSLLGAVSVVGWSQARTLPQLYLAFVGVGLAGAAVLYEPAFAVINTWFDRDRTAALLSLTVLAGFSSTVMLPLSQALNQTLGWRSALLALAALLALTAVPHAVLLRARPADLGLHPDGRPPAGTSPDAHGPGNAGSPASGAAAPAAAAAVRWLSLANVAHTIAITVISVHLIGYLTSAGASGGTAAATAGALGVLQVAGRIALTGLSRRRPLSRVAAVLVAGQALGVASLLTVPGPAGVVVFVVLFGAGFGVMSIARAALLGDYVHPGTFGRVAGRQALLAGASRVIAPICAAAAISTTGYRPTLLAVAACTLLTAAALLAAERVTARTA